MKYNQIHAILTFSHASHRRLVIYWPWYLLINLKSVTDDQVFMTSFYKFLDSHHRPTILGFRVDMFLYLLQNINLPPERASLHVKFSHFYILYWNFCDIKLFYMVMGYLNYYNDLCELLPVLVLVCSFFKRMCNILHLFSSPIF